MMIIAEILLAEDFPAFHTGTSGMDFQTQCCPDSGVWGLL